MTKSILIESPINVRDEYENIVLSIMNAEHIDDISGNASFLIVDNLTKHAFRCMNLANNSLLVFPIPVDTIDEYPGIPTILRSDDSTIDIQIPSRNESQHRKYLTKVHDLSYGNGEDLKKPGINCGCFFCGAMFDSSELDETCFITEDDGKTTAICPDCGIDSIIYDKGDVKVTHNLVMQMMHRFF